MGTLNKQDLLDQIEKCPINFDPLFKHCYGLEQPPKIAFVPLPLWEAIKKAIASLPL